MNHSTAKSSTKIFLSSTGINKTVNSTTLNTDITFYFDPIILANTDKAHMILGLEQVSIPISIYMINSTNNTMVINATTYSIPIGNYTITTLITYLNTVETTIQFLYIPASNQVKVTITPSVTVVISGSASSLLGFVAGSYSNPNTFTNVVNLTSTTGIIIQIENVTTTNRDNSGKTGSTLARLPITCGVNKIMQYFNSTPFYTQIGNRELSFLRVRLLNDDYTALNLVGNPPWFMVIRVDYSDKGDVNESVNGFKLLKDEQIRLEREKYIDDIRAKVESKVE